MQTEKPPGRGAIVRAADFRFEPCGGYEIAEPVGKELGAETVSLTVVRLPAGARWADQTVLDDEAVVLVYAGTGAALVDGRPFDLVQGSAVHSPAGTVVEFTAARSAGVVLYVWRAALLPGRRRGADPKLAGSIFDESVQLRGWTGAGVQAEPADARMNFVFWPGVGSTQMCLHCGIQEAGQVFNVHLHPASEEAFICFEGTGQMYLDDTWHDVSPGDVLFAPAQILHGTRNPSTEIGARRFVTCGGPMPWDPALYRAAGVATEVA